MLSTDYYCLTCGHAVAFKNAPCPQCSAIESVVTYPTRTLFEPSRARLTLVLLGILVILYFGPFLLGGSDGLNAVLNWGDLDVEAVRRHQEYWRLLTGNLLHATPIHLGSNAFSVLIFGALLESQIGWRMLILWLTLFMVGCDIATIQFQVPNSIGASGIAYGLQAAFIVLSGKVMLQNKSQPVLKTLQSLIGYALLVIVMNTIDVNHINTFGHYGGAVAGLICVLAYPVKRPVRAWDYGRYILLIMMGIIFLISFFNEAILLH